LAFAPLYKTPKAKKQLK